MEMVIGKSWLSYEISTAVGGVIGEYAACGCNASISQRHDYVDLILFLHHPAFLFISSFPISACILTLPTVFMNLSLWNGSGNYFFFFLTVCLIICSLSISFMLTQLDKYSLGSRTVFSSWLLIREFRGLHFPYFNPSSHRNLAHWLWCALFFYLLWKFAAWDKMERYICSCASLHWGYLPGWCHSLHGSCIWHHGYLKGLSRVPSLSPQSFSLLLGAVLICYYHHPCHHHPPEYYCLQRWSQLWCNTWCPISLTCCGYVCPEGCTTFLWHTL